jgi:hypothetical protein
MIKPMKQKQKSILTKTNAYETKEGFYGPI